jgi:hypothetical protein
MRRRVRYGGSGGGCGGCLGAAAFSIIFFVVGAGLTYWGWTILQKARASADWPNTRGQIVSSTVSHSTDSEGGDSYTPEVEYTYLVNDLEYGDDTIKFGETSYNSRRNAQEVADRYPAGQSVAVYYDPDNPEEAVLEPGVTAGSYLVLGIGAFFLLLDLIITPIMLIFRRR